MNNLKEQVFCFPDMLRIALPEILCALPIINMELVFIVSIYKALVIFISFKTIIHKGQLKKTPLHQ